MFGVLVTMVGIGLFSEPTTIAETPPETVLTSSTSLKSQSSIFREVTTDGLASYLEININESASSVKTIKIIQTIGSTSQVLTTDETGKECYYLNSLSVNKNTTFYFTRPATYTVLYIRSSDNTRVQESCTFKPELNIDIIKNNIYTTNDGGLTKNTVATTEDKIIFTVPGTVVLPKDSLNLYTISASTDNVHNDDLLHAIPENKFGNVLYTISSKNMVTQLSLECIVLTTEFEIQFSNTEGDLLDKEDYAYLDGYVFNESVNLHIEIKDTATDLQSNVLPETAKVEIFNLIGFSLNEAVRNETNTATSFTTSSIIDHPEESPKLEIELLDADHVIYTVNTNILGSTQNAEYKNNIPAVKIITKVPINEQGIPVFSIVLGQDSNYRHNDYLESILNGYLKDETIVYYSTVGIRIFYNGDAMNSGSISYTFNSSPGSISTSKDFFHNDSIDGTADMRIFNSTLSFEQFYTFPFTMKGYKANNQTFSSAMLNQQMKYNDLYYVVDDFGDVYNSINFPINSFKYIVPSNYETDCIPTHLRVTHNGTTYDDIHKLSNSDEIEFDNYGNYVLEFYNLPSYDFIVNNLQQWSISAAAKNYYYKLEFTITGPSISATSANDNNKNLTVSNNMYIQNSVNCDVNIQQGQKFVVYKNGNEYASREESLNFTLNEIGTWKIAIYNADGVIIKALTFTIVDKIYQGFSINEQIEYLNLTVYKQITSMPVTYQKLDSSTAYHLTQAGTYKIEIDAKENLNFNLKRKSDLTAENTYAYTINSNSFIIEIVKSYFSLDFASGSNGARISEKIVVSSVGGVQLQKLEVLKNGKSIKEFSADQLKDWEAVIEASRTFNDNGTYTFRLTDKFGNTYETQIEKYYKVNVALIFLILIIVALIVVLIVTVIKSRHKIKVK